MSDSCLHLANLGFHIAIATWEVDVTFLKFVAEDLFMAALACIKFGKT